MNYLIYIAALIIVFISFVPMFLLRNFINHTKGPSIIMLKSPHTMLYVFGLPIIAIFLATVLIIWSHKEIRNKSAILTVGEEV